MTDDGHRESFTTGTERLRREASRTLDASEKPDAARMREQALEDLKYQWKKAGPVALREATDIEPDEEYL